MIHISVLEQILQLKRGESGFFLVKTVKIWQGYNLWKLLIMLA